MILPEDLLRRLGATEGSLLHLVEDGEGGVRLAGDGSVLERGMESARKAMDRSRNALAELAK